MTTMVHPSTLVKPSVLTRWNPSIKLLVLTVVSLSQLLVWDPIRPTVLWLVLVLIGTAVASIPLRWLALAHVPFLGFGIGLFLINGLTRETDGWTIGAALAARTLAIGVAAVIFLCTTDPVRLMTSLHHNLKLPAPVTFAVLAGYQLLLDLPQEWQTIRAAQRMRTGAHRTTRTSSRLTLKQARQASFTLFIVVLRRAERIARSLESRGLGLRPRTVYKPVRMTTWDVVAGVGVCVVVLIFVVR